MKKLLTAMQRQMIVRTRKQRVARGLVVFVGYVGLVALELVVFWFCLGYLTGV